MISVTVDDDLEKALRILKKKCNKAGIFAELRRRVAYSKPSERRRSKSLRYQRRLNKNLKRMEN